MQMGISWKKGGLPLICRLLRIIRIMVNNGSIGQLKLTGVSVLSGHAFYDDSNIITTFEILELTDDTMVLCWNPSDAEAWTDATFWCLRKK